MNADRCWRRKCSLYGTECCTAWCKSKNTWRPNDETWRIAWTSRALTGHTGAPESAYRVSPLPVQLTSRLSWSSCTRWSAIRWQNPNLGIGSQRLGPVQQAMLRMKSLVHFSFGFNAIARLKRSHSRQLSPWHWTSVVQRCQPRKLFTRGIFNICQ